MFAMQTRGLISLTMTREAAQDAAPQMTLV